MLSNDTQMVTELRAANASDGEKHKSCFITPPVLRAVIRVAQELGYSLDYPPRVIGQVPAWLSVLEIAIARIERGEVSKPRQNPFEKFRMHKDKPSDLDNYGEGAFSLFVRDESAFQKLKEVLKWTRERGMEGIILSQRPW